MNNFESLLDSGLFLLLKSTYKYKFKRKLKNLCLFPFTFYP